MLTKTISIPKSVLFAILLAGALLAGCTMNPAGTTPAIENPPDPVSEITNTPLQASPTPRPLAARVNGRDVSLAAYQVSLNMLTAADAEQGITRAEEEKRELVLGELYDRALLAAAAEAGGYTLDEAAVSERVSQLEAELGGADALAAWQAQFGVDGESFMDVLRESELAAWQRERIISSVPERMEQVHARQIRVREEKTIQDILGNLNSGADFAKVARQYDPTTGGDLGWFPRGYLLQPEVEEAAFALQAGEVSGIINSQVGYHLVQVIEREAERELTLEARTVLQQKALSAWLDGQRASAQIEVLLP